MTSWLIVASDFVPTGGMDMPNLALARHHLKAIEADLTV